MYALVAARPGLAHVIGVIVSQYMANPRSKHWEAIKAHRYLHGTTEMKLIYRTEKSGVPKGYTGSVYADNLLATCSCTQAKLYLGD